MFRLVLTYPLLLGLIVGPMLCCCTTARLGHDAGTATRSLPSSEQSGRKNCCGEGKAGGHGQQSPGEKPADPTKCPCKDGGTKDVTVPEATSAAADSLTFLGAALAALDLPVRIDSVRPADRACRQLDDGAPFLTASDLLFAHHNLRC